LRLNGKVSLKPAKIRSAIIGRLVQQYQSLIKLVDVTIIRNGVRTKTRWIMQDGAEVKNFIPADAQTEKVC
jgi:hypothetical protein